MLKEYVERVKIHDFFPNCLRKIFSVWNLTGHQKMCCSESKPVGGSVCTLTWLGCSNFLKPLQKRCPSTFSSEGVLLLSATGNVFGGNREFYSWFTSSNPFISAMYECALNVINPLRSI